MAGALLTDLYELTMAASFLRRGMTGAATFSLFVRTLPPTRGFLVAAGLEDCLTFLEGWRFNEQELDYLRHFPRFAGQDLEAFERLRFTGDVWAVPEGRILFANEPLLEVTAPIAQAQLVETYLLNAVSFHTALAAKAARCRIAARGRDLVDFSMRRTQGMDAAMIAARASALVGFAATSNVEAARRFGLPASGTMAHSYVEAFPSETTAFRAFAEDYPTYSTFLVDTYDTVHGIRSAISVIKALELSGRLAIRLDSGDLGILSRQARSLLDEAGLTDVRILVSGGLDELDIDSLVVGGAPIDAFGVGTKMGVSADAPYLDSAYKLTEYDGRPVLKLSAGKRTLPGAKQVFRHWGMQSDIVALRSEPVPAGCESLLRPVMVGGRRTATPDSLEAARQRFEEDFAVLPAGAHDLRNPQPPSVHYSEQLDRLSEQTREELVHRLADDP